MRVSSREPSMIANLVPMVRCTIVPVRIPSNSAGQKSSCSRTNSVRADHLRLRASATNIPSSTHSFMHVVNRRSAADGPWPGGPYVSRDLLLLVFLILPPWALSAHCGWFSAPRECLAPRQPGCNEGLVKASPGRRLSLD